MRAVRQHTDCKWVLLYLERSAGLRCLAPLAYLNDYRTFSDVVERLPHFIEEVFKTRRQRSALGYLAPVQFEELNARDLVQFNA